MFFFDTDMKTAFLESAQQYPMQILEGPQHPIKLVPNSKFQPYTKRAPIRNPWAPNCPKYVCIPGPNVGVVKTSRSDV